VLDQRVPGLPSTAMAASTPAPSADEAVAGRPCAALVVPQVPGFGLVPPNVPCTWNSHSE
jgi:hypothetical protein